MKTRPFYALVALLLSSVSYAYAAEGTEVPNPVDPAPADAAKEATLQASPRPGRSQVQRPGAQMRFSNKVRGSSANTKSQRAMPPAGSAATGGSSASPGGLQTTPYGNP